MEKERGGNLACFLDKNILENKGFCALFSFYCCVVRGGKRYFQPKFESYDLITFWVPPG
jgi:hypothetical protein